MTEKKVLYIAAFLVGLIVGATLLFPYYSVWKEQMRGKAEYARAEYNRRIKTLEAQAEAEAARDYALADSTRAAGRAIANRILSKSLEGSETYLYYLWLENMEKKQGDMIYIPTEANFPIMEAGRFQKQFNPVTDGK